MADDSGSPAGEEMDLSITPAAVRTPRRRALWGVLAAVAVAAGALAISPGGDGGRLPLLPSGANGGLERASGAMAADMSLAYVRYVAGDDLPTLGGEAPAYRLAGSVDEARVRQLADALGLDGEVTHEGDVWRMASDDAVLEVVDDGGAAWWYSQQPDGAVSSSGGGSAGCEPGPAVDCSFTEVGEAVPPTTTIVCGEAADPECPTEDCAAADCVEPVEPQKECPPDGICTEPTPDGECPRDADCSVEPCAPNADGDCPRILPAPIEPVPAADLPSEDEARAIALDLLAATGADVDDAKVTIDGPYEAWYVNVEHAIDGVPVSGWFSSVGVGPQGEILHANGILAETERLGDYPLLDTRAAIDRLNDQQAVAFGGGWSAYPGAAEDAVATGTEPSADTTMLPPCAPDLSPEELERCFAEAGYAVPPAICDSNDDATVCPEGGCEAQPDGSEICSLVRDDPCAGIQAADGGTTGGEDPVVDIACSPTAPVECLVTPAGGEAGTTGGTDEGPVATTTLAPLPPDVATSCVPPAPCAEPGSAEAPATTVPGTEESATTAPSTADQPVTTVPECGPLPEPEPVEVVLTEATEVLVLTVDASGATYLVPGYRFGNAEGTQVDVAAVDDDHLAPTTTIPEDTSVTPATEPAPNDCEVLVEEDAAGTTHTINPCVTTTTIGASEARPLEGGEEPSLGVPYRVELIPHCVNLVDWDGRWWGGDEINAPEGWTGNGTFTLTSEDAGYYTDDAEPSRQLPMVAKGETYPGCA